MDFGALPPEVNSACIYAGAGPAPMLAAAAAWSGISDELRTAASSFDSVVQRLSGEAWVGYASLSMVAAARPFVDWLTCTAESSARAATQAMSSVAAYETAFAMMVPPAEVAANRAELAALTATNTFGQNTPAIAVLEARYSEMWARDAAAMYGYAASSAAAARLDPLTSPSATTSAAGIANMQQAGLVSLITQGPAAVQSLAAPEAVEDTGTTLLDLFVEFDQAELWWADEFDHNRATYYDYSIGQIGTNSGDDDAEEIAGPVAKRAAMVHPVRPTPTAAGLGRAHTVGQLSVPASWSDSAPVRTARTVVDGTYWAVPEHDESGGAVPLAPGTVATAGGTGAPGPRYGVKPIVMPRQRIV